MVMNKEAANKEKMQCQQMVFIIDDDVLLRDAIKNLLHSVGLHAETFGTTAEFLQVKLPEVPRCLILDVRLPGVSGLDFQGELDHLGQHMPIIFMTGYGDIPMSVRAMKAGAVEFLTKPFRDQDLLDSVRVALERDREQRHRDQVIAKVRTAFETLTSREQEVIALVTSGRMNKQIAGDLGISEITVKVHRGNATHKLGARSLAELVRMADVLGIQRGKN
jgi:FixJ family two-component response regulator